MKVLEFGRKPKRWIEPVVCLVLIIVIVLVGANSSSVQAGDEKPAEEPALNNWARAFDWDETGEKPASYQIGGIKRFETVPDTQVFKKLLRDLPVGMGAYVREEALKLDATRHGWLRADAVICNRFVAHEFPVYVTRWEGGYYVHPSRSFEEGKGTYKAEDGFIPVKAFCWPEPGMVGFVIQMKDLEHIYKGPDPATDAFK